MEGLSKGNSFYLCVFFHQPCWAPASASAVLVHKESAAATPAQTRKCQGPQRSLEEKVMAAVWEFWRFPGMEGKMEGLEPKWGAYVVWWGSREGTVRHPSQSKQLGRRADDVQFREEEFK